MVRYLFPVIGAALLAAGCVPVTEPVGEIEKAEPDKNLVGKWTTTDSADLAKHLEVETLTVDVPEVKGNPKGLMRGTTEGGKLAPQWFFTTTVGKHTYANVILGTEPDWPEFKFDKEGEYAKWKKEEKKRYFMFRYVRDGDKLTIDAGNFGKFKEIMKEAKITFDEWGGLEVFDAPDGGFAKYFDKNGPEKIFDKTNYLALKREKK
jgi:hypothetical protein